MVDSRELTPGMSMDFPPVPLRVALTGVTDGVRVQVLRRDSSEAGGRRVSDTELIVLPIAGSYAVEAVPAEGVAFGAGSRLGIDVTTDSSSVESRQGFLQPADVGALQSVQLATLTYRSDGWVVTAASAGHAAFERKGRKHRPTAAIDDQAHPWVGPGRFALRRAVADGVQIRSSEGRGWGLVLDSSASMRGTFRQAELEHLVQVVAGVFGEWTAQPPAASYLSGVTQREEVTGPDPRDAVGQAFAAAQPAAWSIVTPAVRACADVAGESAAVLVFTDGVPGDVADLRDLLEDEPSLEVFLLTTGVSRFGLPSDTADREAWQEQLSGLELLAELPNVTIAALRVDGPVDEGRSAELAAALLGEGA